MNTQQNLLDHPPGILFTGALEVVGGGPTIRTRVGEVTSQQPPERDWDDL